MGTEECEKVFVELKQFLSAPPILVRRKENSFLILYLEVSEKAISLVLVQDDEGEEMPIYFVSRVLKGVEIRYQKIERLTLAVVLNSMKLRQYFQGQPIIVQMNYPVKQILKKPYLVDIMVAWAMELSEYDITYSPRTSIKSQVLEDFIMELSAPILEEVSE